RGDADRGATAAVPRSGAPFPARSELRVQRLGDAGVGLGKPARAALPLHAVRRRRVLAGRAAMDLELLRGHWRYGTGAAWRVAVARSPKSDPGRGGVVVPDLRAGQRGRRSYPGEKDSAVPRVGAVPDQVRRGDDFRRAIAGGAGGGALANASGTRIGAALVGLDLRRAGRARGVRRHGEPASSGPGRTLGGDGPKWTEPDGVVVCRDDANA